MYLSKAPSGFYHFRLRIPKSCQPYYRGRTEIKKSLKTTNKRIAQPLANKLYENHMTSLKNIYLEMFDGTKIEIDQETPEQELKTAEALLNNVSGRGTPLQENLSGLITAYLEDTKGSVIERP